MLAITVASIAQAQHYYSGGKAIPLTVDSSYVTVRFAEVVPLPESQVLLGEIGRIVQVVDDDHAIDDFLICSLYTGVDYDSFLDSLDTLSGIELVEPYYRNEYDSAILVGMYFCVGFNPDLSSAQVDSINDAHGVIIDHELEGMANVFVVRNTASSGYRMLELANLYYKLKQTYFSHPEFSVRPVPFAYSLYDYFGDNQPHIKKVIGDFNEASVWDFAGLDRMVTVAVIDDGIAVHEDLPAERILYGRNFVDPEYDPSPGPN